MKRKVLFEIAILITVSFIIGFTYTYVTKQGFFKFKQENITIEMVNIEKAKELYTSPDVIFIDSRHEFEFKMGHIKGAINIPLNESEKFEKFVENTSKSRSLVIYCDGAECNSSFELGGKLLQASFKNIKVMYGGWQQWLEHNLPIESEK